MPEIHPAVDADVINAQKLWQQEQEEIRLTRKRLAEAKKIRVQKRLKYSTRSLIWKALAVIAIVALLSIFTGVGFISTPFANFLKLTVLYWLAIQLGAWLQYVFCERGYMK